MILGAVRRWLRQALPSALALLAGAPAWAGCGDSLPAAQRQLAGGDGLQIAFAAQPAPLALGRHFALDIVVCPCRALYLRLYHSVVVLMSLSLSLSLPFALSISSCVSLSC